MLFQPAYGSPPHKPSLLTDATAKAILLRQSIIWLDAGRLAAGKVIGWKTTNAGTTGAIVAFPSGARHLFGVDFRTGEPKHLSRLA